MLKLAEKLLPVTLSFALVISAAAPAFAAELSEETAIVSGLPGQPASDKEEVVYITLQADGSVKDTYVVNSFSGGEITDYGDYASVKMLNTDDAITQNGDTVSISSSAPKVYYQGNLPDVQIPWDISLRYFLDGTEYTASDMAGKSGHLEILFQVTRNEYCEGTFFDDYALQASFVLDTGRCANISAPDATIASVGSDKQLTYTILPGKGIDTAISADVDGFEMSAVSINGIHLNLNVEVDDEELKQKVNEVMDAAVRLDDGAIELSDGSEELRSGTSDLKAGASDMQSGIASLDEGVADLQEGLSAVQEGLDSLNARSADLVDGSAQIREALTTIQTAVNGVSVSTEELTQLAAASGQIRQAVSDLSEGAAALQASLGWAQYQAIMAQNGLDIEELAAGNASAAETIKGYEALLEQLGSIPGYEEIVSQYAPALTEAAEQMIALLNANQAALNGTEAYLTGLEGQLPAFTQGLAALNEQYQVFDETIGQLVTMLGGMTENLSALTDGINQLTEKYGELDDGISGYTDGVSQIVDGYGQLMDGVAALAEGSKELLDGSGDLYSGAADLYDGVASLCDGARDMADGTEEFRSETSGMDEKIDDQIDEILDSIGGSMENPVSFVSEKNGTISAVQFVIQTEAIQQEETAQTVAAQPETKTFWQKLLDLFR